MMTKPAYTDHHSWLTMVVAFMLSLALGYILNLLSGGRWLIGLGGILMGIVFAVVIYNRLLPTTKSLLMLFFGIIVAFMVLKVLNMIIHFGDPIFANSFALSLLVTIVVKRGSQTLSDEPKPRM